MIHNTEIWNSTAEHVITDSATNTYLVRVVIRWVANVFVSIENRTWDVTIGTNYGRTFSVAVPFFMCDLYPLYYGVLYLFCMAVMQKRVFLQKKIPKAPFSKYWSLCMLKTAVRYVSSTLPAWLPKKVQGNSMPVRCVSHKAMLQPQRAFIQKGSNPTWVAAQ